MTIDDLKEQDVIDLLSNYHNSSTVDKLQESLRHKSVLEILGVGRKELYHSNFLAWLFDPEESHGLGTFPIRKLLLVLATRNLYSDQEKVSMPQWLQHEILRGGPDIKSVTVTTEEPTPSTSRKGQDNGRVDILIDISIAPVSTGEGEISQLRIVLENKVFSGENGTMGNQTEVYYKCFEKCKPKEQHCIYTYLTPIGKDRCYDPHFIHITYQDVLDKILESSTKRSGISEHTIFVLQEYIKNLSVTMDSKNSVPMAITEEHRNLLSKFWDENKDLIIACLEVLSENPECGMQEEVKTAADVLSSISKNSGRHNLKFSFDYRGKHYPGPWGQGRLIQNVVSVYAKENKCNYQELEKVFPWTLQNSSKNATDPYGCVRPADYAKVKARPERYFSNQKDYITLDDGTKVVVCSQWGTLENNGGNFPIFRKHAEKLGFEFFEV